MEICSPYSVFQKPISLELLPFGGSVCSGAEEIAVWIASSETEEREEDFITFSVLARERVDSHRSALKQREIRSLHVACRLVPTTRSADSLPELSDPVTIELIDSALELCSLAMISGETKAQVVHMLLRRLVDATENHREVTSPCASELDPWQKQIVETSLLAPDKQATSLETLAKRCGLSVCHFSRLSKATFGIPLHQYVMQYKIERACTMLRDTQEKISQIALECGFSDQSSFTRRFSAIRGTSPGEWRKAVLSAKGAPAWTIHGDHSNDFAISSECQ